MYIGKYYRPLKLASENILARYVISFFPMLLLGQILGCSSWLWQKTGMGSCLVMTRPSSVLSFLAGSLASNVWSNPLGAPPCALQLRELLYILSVWPTNRVQVR